MLRNPHVALKIGRGVYFGPGFSLYAPYGGASLEIGEGVEFRRGTRIDLGRGAQVRIGAGVRMTYGTVLQAGERIEIGDGCMVGQSVMLVDGGHQFRDPARHVLEQGYSFRPVVLEPNVTIMSKCTVIGARIGQRTVVGAHAVVTRDLPAFCVAVGAPARPIESFDPDSSQAAERRP